MFVDAWLGVVPELEHHVDGVPRHTAVRSRRGIKAEDGEISWKAAGANAPMEAPVGLMVKLGNALGDHEGVVVRHAGNASTEDDLLGHRDGCSNEQVRG